MPPSVVRYCVKHFKNGYISFKEMFLALGTQKNLIVLLLVAWMIVTYFMIQPLRCIDSYKDMEEVKEKLRQESIKLEVLNSQNQQLSRRNLFDLLRTDDLNTSARIPVPEFENLRRRIYSNTKELWLYLSNQLEDVSEQFGLRRIRTVLTEVANRKRSLLSDQETLLLIDGFTDWRRNEAASVSDLVQRRLHYLQNPSDCRNARKLVCDLNKPGGFGCQIHHLIYCLIVGYATERTVILKSKGWQHNDTGWEAIFQPLSETCTSLYGEKAVQWPAPKNTKVLLLPITEKIKRMPKYLPPVVPQDLAHRIVRFNGDVSSWWVGQILKFVLKPVPPVQSLIDRTIAKIRIKAPYVGIHIRRTDKAREALYHDVSEYMVHVSDYFKQLELTATVNILRVYIATDEPKVLEEARRKYPEYVFYGDPSIAASASVNRRATTASLIGLLVDLTLLARANFIVCTFSSNVGRMAYELMQTNKVDASDRYFSLDKAYHFINGFALDRIAVMANRGGEGDISFEVGDQLGVVPGTHKDGYERGTNKKTFTAGLIPWYKTVEHVMTYSFPVYTKVPIIVDLMQI